MSERSIERARALRRELTSTETILWSALRGGRAGAKVRRQHAIGPYVADFCCVSARLVMEVDGGTHFEPEAIEHDRRRTVFFEACGFEVLRFTNDQVRERPREVVEQIARAIAERLR